MALTVIAGGGALAAGSSVLLQPNTQTTWTMQVFVCKTAATSLTTFFVGGDSTGAGGVRAAFDHSAFLGEGTGGQLISLKVAASYTNPFFLKSIVTTTSYYYTGFAV